MDNTIKKIEENVSASVKAVEKKIVEVEENVVKTEKKLIHNKWVQSGAVVVTVLAAAAGFIYIQLISTRVTIDTSLISAPTIDLSVTAPGTLEAVYVNEGDMVPANTVVAKVGDELIKTKVSGQIITVHNDTGKIFNPGEPVVSMIDPSDLRVVGTIEEDKGLSKIQVGQGVTFTVDAFGSKTYEGIVDEISPTSHQTGVVFNISDKRAVQQFDVKVRYDISKYPELKNGMSAKMTIFYR